MPRSKSQSTRSKKGQRSRSRLGTYAHTVPGHDLGLVPLDKKRINWSKVLAVVLLLGSLVMLYSFFSSARFRVRDVVVEGANLVQESDVELAANLRGTSIFRVQAGELAVRLREGFGSTAQASVLCELPNKVTITLQEHESVLAWESGGQYWWVDIQGNILGVSDGPGELIVVHDIGTLIPEPQDYVVGVPWELALEMTQAMPAIRAFDYTREEGLILYVTANRWPVFLGHRGEGRNKIALMRSLVDQLAAKGVGVEYIDLRNELRPTFGKR